MKYALPALALLLPACGAEAPPRAPEPAPAAGVTIGGEARIGVRATL